MPENRYFIRQPFLSGHSVTLGNEELHHMHKVMRKTVGDAVELVNGKGELAHATIQELSKTRATLQIQDVFSEETHFPHLILAIALPRMPRLEWIIEKATELGVTGFWLFPGDRSEKKTMNQAQFDRLDHLAIVALKQCGRLRLPEIREMPVLREWQAESSLQYLFGDVDPEAPFLKEALISLDKKHSFLFFVGPESGFSQEEEEILKSKLSAKGVKLSHYILRAETAAITAAAQLIGLIGI